MKNVSRETSEKLRAFEALVVKWTRKINLIAPSTIKDIRNRHTLDSLQLFTTHPKPGPWLDMGSGGGFPGIVIAIAMQEYSKSTNVAMVESDSRKCVFLRQAARELDLNVTVHNARLEDFLHSGFPTASARALAPLSKLIDYAHPRLDEHGVLMTPKGQSWKKDLEAAQLRWSFDYDVIQSESQATSVLLKVTNIERKSE